MAHFSTQMLKVYEPFPAVFHVQLARPPVNAFSTEFWREYGALFDSLADAHASGTDIRAVVLSSSIPKIFTAGLDINSSNGLETAALASQPGFDASRTALGLRHRVREFQHAIGAPDRCLFPVIVAIHGTVLGLGVDIISACDIRYAAANSVFSIKEVDVGLAPDIGTLAYLPKITGNLSLVRELTYTGRNFSALEAEKLGLVSRVVDGGRDEVIEAALDLARTIASKSPVAVVGSKHLISHARDNTVADNLLYTAAWNGAGLMTSDLLEAKRARKAKEIPKFMAFQNARTKL